MTGAEVPSIAGGVPISSAARGQGAASRRWTWIIGAGLHAMLRRRAAHLSDVRRRGAEAGAEQRSQLRGLLRTARNTEWGRRFGFARLADLPESELVAAYQREVPTADYEAMRADLARMREHAAPDVTWPGIVMDWAQTSGTTGGQKYIPVSRRMLASNRRAALDIFAHAMRFGIDLRDLFAGRCLFLGGSTDVAVNEHGIRTGDLSGLVTPLIRWPISAVYSPGREIALMSDWPAKIDAMARLGLRQDVRMVSGMASWSLVLFQRMLELSGSSGPGARALRDIWPRLTLFVHGGVSYAPFEPRVREAWSGAEGTDIPHRLEVYPASEGFIAVQDQPGDPGLRLHVDNGIFFEFVPLEEIDSAGARACTVEQVEPGQRYVVVMSTCAGLWRYVIGDVVEFDTIPPAGPPRLRIVGRHRHFVNAFGENLIVEDIERAAVAARDAAGIEIGEFTAGPVYPGDGRRAGLELVVEASAPRESIERFARVFDQTLRSVNVDYDTKRTADLGMAPAIVRPVPPGTFHRWMERRGKLGGQHKCPRCANHREFIEALTAPPETGAPAKDCTPECHEVSVMQRPEGVRPGNPSRAGR